MLRSIILRDDKLSMFMCEMEIQYDYVILEIDVENKQATYIVEDGVRFSIAYELAKKYITTKVIHNTITR